MMKTLLAVVLCVIGCACATPYQKSGVLGGFKETEIKPDVYLIKFQGNGWTDAGKVQGYALIRACELCIEKGYTHLQVLLQNEGGYNTSMSTPSSSTTTGQIDAFGNITAETTHHPGSTTTFFHPSSSVGVRFFHEKPTEGTAYNAVELRDALKKYHGFKN